MPTALVIEDNRMVSDMLCQLLNLLDIKSRPAYTPRAAFLSLTEETPNVVFLDINLPNVDGFEVLAYIRREPRLSRVPVIVVTSEDQPEVHRRAKEGGAVTVIIKPATLEALEKSLHQAGIF